MLKLFVGRSNFCFNCREGLVPSSLFDREYNRAELEGFQLQRKNYSPSFIGVGFIAASKLSVSITFQLRRKNYSPSLHSSKDSVCAVVWFQLQRKNYSPSLSQDRLVGNVR